jgi:LacI family transcriptional regulator
MCFFNFHWPAHSIAIGSPGKYFGCDQKLTRPISGGNYFVRSSKLLLTGWFKIKYYEKLFVIFLRLCNLVFHRAYQLLIYIFYLLNMRGINLKKLAEELGLSISSVSKALRDSHEISAETKKRVLALAEKLHYQPNPFASGLRKNKSNTIAVVIPEIANNFFALAMDGIQLVAHQKGYHVLTYLTHEDYKVEVSTIDHLQDGRVDGVLISMCGNTGNIKHLHDLHATGIPLVFFDRVPEKMECPMVTTDDFESGFNATEHLLLAGCKKVAYLGVTGILSTTNNRQLGYEAALKKHKIPLDKKLIVQCSNDNEGNLALLKKLLGKKDRPDGVFASVEKLAISTYYVCNEIKLKIPQQLKVISFSNLRTASLLSPSLSTITQPAFEIGKESAELLFKIIRKSTAVNPTDKIILQSTLIERGSSARS